MKKEAERGIARRSRVDANYSYWRQHGNEWRDEYQRRKTWLVYYHLQELMLADYFAHSAPARILEFGCGTGRHLSYLREIPGLDVFGHDQSASMVANILEWAERSWFDEHITVGEPLGPLPFPDDHFDIVFTSEVLVHVSPDDLDPILRELVRVSRWQVLHFEPAASTRLVIDEHAGCWYHDLAAAYDRLGHDCEQLPPGFAVQAPCRVMLSGEKDSYIWTPVPSTLWQQMDRDLQPTLDQVLALRTGREELLGQLASRDDELGAARERIADIERELIATTDTGNALNEDLTAKLAYITDLEQELISSNSLLDRVEADLAQEHSRVEIYSSQLYLIQSSAGYRLMEGARRSPLGRPMAILFKAFRWVVRGLRRLIPSRRSTTVIASHGRSLSTTPVPAGHMRLTPRPDPAEHRVGYEIWLLAVENAERTEPYELDRIDVEGDFELRDGASTPSGQALVLVGWRARADVAAQPGDEIVLMRHPWGGTAVLEWNGATVEVNLHGPDGRARCTLRESAIDVVVETNRDAGRSRPHSHWPGPGFSDKERAWLDSYSADPKPLSVGHPEWRGIRSSAEELFDELLFIGDDLDESTGRRHARLFAEASCPAIVIQGFPQTYRHLVLALREVAPSIPVYVIWHGNFLQAREDYAWGSFRTVEQLAREGLIAKIGFVKKGMAEILAAQGLNTGFVMNRVRRIPSEASQPLSGGPHLGIWNIVERWHKPPYAMIAAASVIPGSVLHISGTSARAHEALEFWRLERRLHSKAIAQDDMPSVLKSMHLNLNVTLSECAPMIPLESLSLGVPCLLGPTSHYFDDHDYLKSRLVVPAPDSASSIGEYALRALEERDAIIDEYRLYAPGYNERAGRSLERFLELPTSG